MKLNCTKAATEFLDSVISVVAVLPSEQQPFNHREDETPFAKRGFE